MFDFESFEKEIDEQNAALESMLAEMDNVDGTDSTNTDADAEESIAEEGLLSKPKSTDDMIAKVQKSVNKKCKTVEDCDDFLAKLKNEEQKFNSSLKAMKAAAIQFQKDGDKKALKAAIKPAKAELAKTCSIISLKDVGSADSITDEEIKKLKGFLTGARKVIAEKKKELKNAAKAATESVDSLDFDVEETDIAVESLMDNIRKIALSIVNKLIQFCSTRFKKHNTSKGKDTKAKFWYDKLMTCKKWKEKLNGKIEAAEAEKIKKEAEKAKAECESKAAEEDKEDPASQTDPNQLGNESFILKSFDLECKKFDLACEEYNSVIGYGCESFFDMINGEDEEEPQTAEEAAFIAGYNSAMEAMQDAQIEQALEEIDTLFEFE